MSRKEDNEKMMLSLLENTKFTSADTAMLALVLTDISQSLAVIADCCLDKWQKARKHNNEKDMFILY